MKKIFYLTIFIAVCACSDKKTNTAKVEENAPKEQTEKVIDTVDLSIEENKLVQIHNNIQVAMGNLRNDSLVATSSKQFTDSLIDLIKNNKNTLYYPFKKLQKVNALKMATSTDNNLKVYSWDNNLGGTMRFYNQIYQFNANGTIIAKEHLASNDPQAFFSKIYTVQNSAKEPIYLIISNSVLSSKYSVQHINAYKINSENIEPAAVFKTKTDTLEHIHVEFDFFSVVDRPERPVELITLENNMLKIALVDEQQNVTNKNLIYEWNGDLFVYKGIR